MTYPPAPFPWKGVTTVRYAPNFSLAPPWGGPAEVQP